MGMSCSKSYSEILVTENLRLSFGLFRRFFRQHLPTRIWKLNLKDVSQTRQQLLTLVRNLSPFLDLSRIRQQLLTLTRN